MKNENDVYFLEELSNYLITGKYARYIPEKKRRETWLEAIERDEKMHLKKYSYLPKEDLNRIKWSFDLVEEKKCIPSMRSLQFGGKAVDAHNPRIYNCCVRHIDSLRSFAEVFYALLCGCGVGLGLSRFFLNRLPNLASPSDKTGTILTYVVEDTIEGWSDSIEALLDCYFLNTPYTGRKIAFDYSRIRKEGTPLKTSGGKAPSYRGLKNAHQKIKKLLDYIIEVKHQDRLKSINAYDILMHCADAVLSGGVRRSATSIIFDKDDEDLIMAKIDLEIVHKGRFEKNEKTGKYEGYVQINDSIWDSKQKFEVELKESEWNYLKDNHKISWIHIHPQRARSNNSVLILRNEISFEEFQKILERTKQYGEPAFVFANHPWTLFNPCFEIGFIPVTEDGVCGMQFCNLTSVNGAKIKSKEDFYEVCEAITIIGTCQAGYTYFPYLSPASRKLTEDESLLGCSITGIFNNSDILLSKEILKKGAELCVKINREWAKKLGINPASRITCLKPEGTGSLALSDKEEIPASGAHYHHAKEYFRLVQANKQDPVYKYFKKINPHMVEESVWSANKTDDVIYFPIVAPEGSLTKEDTDAIKHLKAIKLLQQNWVLTGTTESNKKDVTNNVSVTIDVADDEWDKVTEFLYLNREYFSAVSLLPKMGDHIFPQAPLQRIDTEERREKWNKVIKDFKHVDYTLLKEEEDNTNMQSEASCVGGNCDVITS